MCCLSALGRALVSVPAFACMSVRMSTHSWGQTLTHKWNLATWVPGSLSWARTAADLASLSGAVSTRQDSKRRAWRGRTGEGRAVVEGMVTSREPLPKSGLLSPAKEAPCWHAVSAEKLESSAARSAAVKIMRAKRTNKLWWAEKPATLCHPPLLKIETNDWKSVANKMMTWQKNC